MSVFGLERSNTAPNDVYDHVIDLIDSTKPKASPERSYQDGSRSNQTPRAPSLSGQRTKGHLRKELARRKYARWQEEKETDVSGSEVSGDDPRSEAAAKGISKTDTIRSGRLRDRVPFRPKKKAARSHAGLDAFIDVLYENQRGWWFCGIPLYSSNSLLNFDPAGWQTSTFQDSPVDITNAQVPDPSWRWDWRNWYVDMSYDVDEEGWQYSFSFGNQFAWHGNHPWYHSYARRRRWLRKRVKTDTHRGKSTKEAHRLNADYFTIHPQTRNRSRDSSADRANTYRSSLTDAHQAVSEGDDALGEIGDIAALLAALKRAIVDREKIAAVKAFLSQGGDELFYLAQTMPTIRSDFVHQTSQRQLQNVLLQTLQEVTRSEEDEQDADKQAANKRKIDNILKAIHAGGIHSNDVDFWGRLRARMTSSETDPTNSTGELDATEVANPSESGPEGPFVDAEAGNITDEIKGLSDDARIFEEPHIGSSTYTEGEVDEEISKTSDKGKGNGNILSPAPPGATWLQEGSGRVVLYAYEGLIVDAKVVPINRISAKRVATKAVGQTLPRTSRPSNFLPLSSRCGSGEHTAPQSVHLHGIMVVFVDLEDEPDDKPPHSGEQAAGSALPGGSRFASGSITRKAASHLSASARTSADERPNPNLNTLSKALGCYPSALTKHHGLVATPLAEADTTYRRVWTWRTRYTTYLGGLGTGIGEGNEGVKCARGADCKGALEVEVEFECPTSASSPVPGSASSHGESSGNGSDGEEASGTPMKEKEEAGYWRQEIEGLGGVVKKKFRKRERIGGTVREWEDESKGGAILAREKAHEDRAWCASAIAHLLPDASAFTRRVSLPIAQSTESVCANLLSFAPKEVTMGTALRSRQVAPAEKSSIQHFGKISKAQPAQTRKSTLTRKLESQTDAFEKSPIVNDKKRKAGLSDTDRSPPPTTPRKKARLPANVEETPTKGATSLLESFTFASSKQPVSYSWAKQLETPPSSQGSDTSSDVTKEIAELIDLHSCFLTALSLHYAHNGSMTPADLRVLCPNISRTWQKRRVHIDDIRSLLTILQPNKSDKTFVLSDYGNGKTCLELSESASKRARRRLIDEESLNALFKKNLLSQWQTFQNPDPSTPQVFLASFPLYPITPISSAAKLEPLRSKGQTRLTELKAGAIQAQARALKVSTGNIKHTSTGTTSIDSYTKTQPTKPAVENDPFARSAALKCRIFARQQEQQSHNGVPLNAEQLARRRALLRLPEVAPVLESLALSFGQRQCLTNDDAILGAFGDAVAAGARNLSFTMPTLVQNLQMSLRNPISTEEAALAVRILGKMTPEWVSIRSLGKVVGVTVKGMGVGRKVLDGRIAEALERL
ncbi:uncharacterized protein KY384_006084 [Bacidia gigantensis]|uniref:uncharacterized protein n=1 Tax=Bacidia gigantensis TaxID=2732470 RepID=UPI001D0502EF|nr:uncharacterized protein KY384_006084 [Bacidia gigantensis]KAG8529447.1 hypothetical protein KY384_006084 [Bacidia gigantensis]